MYLIIVGWVGVLTGTAFVHLTPYGISAVMFVFLAFVSRSDYLMSPSEHVQT